MKSKAVRRILEMVLMSVLSFIGFNLAFMLAAVVILSLVQILGPLGHLIGRPVFIVLLTLLTWFVFRFKLPVWAKASIYSMNLMSVLVVVGIYLFAFGPLWNTLLLGITMAALVIYLVKTHKPWQYSFSTVFVGLTLAYVILAGVEI